MIAGSVRQICDGLSIEGLRSNDEDVRVFDHCGLVGPTVAFTEQNEPARVALSAALADGWERVRYGRATLVLCPGCVAEAKRQGRFSEHVWPFPRIATAGGAS